MPVYEGESKWDPNKKCFQFRHTQRDKDHGIRACFVDLFEGLRGSHQDVQVADPCKLLLAYVAKYASKFSDSFLGELLCDDADGDSVAASVLSRYKPLEPEMILQMFGFCLDISFPSQ